MEISNFFGIFSLFFILGHVEPSIPDYEKQRPEKNLLGAKQANEMLIPRYSTTALMCEPVFSGPSGTAKWIKDGREVATVTSTSNAILHNRVYRTEQPVPDVGFLIITNITQDDEGRYWCRREDTGQEGDTTTITVAFVEQFPVDAKPTFRPQQLSVGEPLDIFCPRTTAMPKPSVTWILNGEPVNLSTSRVTARNSTLSIRQFLAQDTGLYECSVSNFAGRTSAKVFIEANPDEEGPFQVDAEPRDAASDASCRSFASQSAILWFLVGSLATCCFLLCYMLSALYCLRKGTRNRLTFYPALFLRSYSGLGPGFRKTVVPTPDLCRDHRLP